MANTLAYYDMATITAVKSFIVQAPGVDPIKLITAVIYGFMKYAGVFLLGKPFQPSLMFAGKAGSYLNEAPFRIGSWPHPQTLH